LDEAGSAEEVKGVAFVVPGKPGSRKVVFVLMLAGGTGPSFFVSIVCCGSRELIFFNLVQLPRYRYDPDTQKRNRRRRGGCTG
jgi:hypothetical protein